MRLRRPTIVESLAMVAVLDILAVLICVPDSAASAQRSLERRARNWKSSGAPTVPDRSLIATDIALNGTWTTRRRLSYTQFTFVRRRDGKYNVQFSTGGCLGGCRLSRVGTLSEGVLVLDGAVAEYGRRTYDTLYTVRIGGVDCLLPAESVQDFERAMAAGSDDWRRFVHSRRDESSQQGAAHRRSIRSESHNVAIAQRKEDHSVGQSESVP